jgi:hypothetical protein
MTDEQTGAAAELTPDQGTVVNYTDRMAALAADRDLIKAMSPSQAALELERLSHAYNAMVVQDTATAVVADPLVDIAMSGRDAPLGGMTTTPDHPLSDRDRLSFVADMRARGHSDAEIFLQLTGRTVATGRPPDAAELATYRAHAEKLFGDPDMRARLMRGDGQAVRAFQEITARLNTGRSLV